MKKTFITLISGALVFLIFSFMQFGFNKTNLFEDIRTDDIVLFVHAKKTSSRFMIFKNVSYGNPYRLTFTLKANQRNSIGKVEGLLLRNTHNDIVIDLLDSSEIVIENRISSGENSKWIRVDNLVLGKVDHTLSVIYNSCSDTNCKVTTKEILLKFSQSSKFTSNWIENLMGI